MCLDLYHLKTRFVIHNHILCVYVHTSPTPLLTMKTYRQQNLTAREMSKVDVNATMMVNHVGLKNKNNFLFFVFADSVFRVSLHSADSDDFCVLLDHIPHNNQAVVSHSCALKVSLGKLQTVLGLRSINSPLFYYLKSKSFIAQLD